jgi:hypothetical protein
MIKQKYNYNPEFLSGEISPIYAIATESHLNKTSRNKIKIFGTIYRELNTLNS